MHPHGEDYNALRFLPITYQERAGKVGKYCSYCGSVDPKDLAKAIRENGTKLSPTDQKYGWPHKYYTEGGPEGFIKFYTEHLMDATEEDAETIMQEMGLRITFEENPQTKRIGIRWVGFKPKPTLDNLPPGVTVAKEDDAQNSGDSSESR